MTQTPTPHTDAEEGAIFAAFSEDRISAKQAIRAMAAESRRHEREAAARVSLPMTGETPDKRAWTAAGVKALLLAVDRDPSEGESYAEQLANAMNTIERGTP